MWFGNRILRRLPLLVSGHLLGDENAGSQSEEPTPHAASVDAGSSGTEADGTEEEDKPVSGSLEPQQPLELGSTKKGATPVAAAGNDEPRSRQGEVGGVETADECGPAVKYQPEGTQPAQSSQQDTNMQATSEKSIMDAQETVPVGDVRDGVDAARGGKTADQEGASPALHTEGGNRVNINSEQMPPNSDAQLPEGRLTLKDRTDSDASAVLQPPAGSGDEVPNRDQEGISRYNLGSSSAAADASEKVPDTREPEQGPFLAEDGGSELSSSDGSNSDSEADELFRIAAADASQPQPNPLMDAFPSRAVFLMIDPKEGGRTLMSG